MNVVNCRDVLSQQIVRFVVSFSFFAVPFPPVPFDFRRLSDNDLPRSGICCPYRGFAKGWFPKGWFWRMFPRNENRNEGTFTKTTLLETALLSPSDPFWFPKGWFRRMFPRNENRNEGTFAKTTLLRNRPFISQ